MKLVSSRDNPRLKALRKLARDSSGYRRAGEVWIEGEHLCRAAVARGWAPSQLVVRESAWPRYADLADRHGADALVLADALMADLSALESPSPLGMVLVLPPAPALDPATATVILDRIQDAGNVGSILRSAAAFGYRQVIALSGTAALWSPKVVRAGMGAHFALNLIEGMHGSQLAALTVPLLVTSSHGGQWLHDGGLPSPCAWIFGHEGQGVATDLMARAKLQVRIAQPGGEESLNVAAAAAICLHATMWK